MDLIQKVKKIVKDDLQDDTTTFLLAVVGYGLLCMSQSKNAIFYPHRLAGIRLIKAGVS